jgi:acyl dehydratase
VSSWRIGPQTRADIVRYQGASGDFNPIHHDDEFARSGGMPGAFSVGMLQVGYLGTYCTDLYGPENIRRLGVRFLEQVWPGDVLVCSGRIVKSSTDPVTGEQLLELELEIRRESGATVVAGSADVVVPPSR